jgi:hypothetical protein
LFDNSVYMVGGQGGEKTLPKRDQSGTYHIDGQLVVADKAAVKGLLGLLTPLLKLLGNSRKLFLTPLARYWVGPCCDNDAHHVNYRTQSYLPRLGDAIRALRDNIRDGLFTRRVPNFRVLCPNRMVGVGHMRSEPSDEEAALSAALWGTDPVHPTAAAYRKMGELIEADLANLESRYTNPTQKHPSDKRPRTDLSLQRADWVAGCSAAASRRDNQRSMGQRPRALSRGGRAALRGAQNRGNPGSSVSAASQREHQSTRDSAAAARGHFMNRGRRPSRGWRGRWGSF